MKQEQKTCRKWCVHKIGSEQFGTLCSTKEEALYILQLNLNKIDMTKYTVREVTIAFED